MPIIYRFTKSMPFLIISKYIVTGIPIRDPKVEYLLYFLITIVSLRNGDLGFLIFAVKSIPMQMGPADSPYNNRLVLEESLSPSST
ncbi:hypothetical protein LEP1GSC058_1628 [Leptospira fainei serovar Hurstbridge str. BUT 6]|uniref:Uncharacterized protein n=1 Tax=Leptospira fainei serovar Hurstbridge str. BUT 6 TaxID=1193011 RepID=S3VEH1_9LEPT|nr:hypothetical protein LEP1GSC058_1628 [Leptospira fainei serovar Hurstbridge str. BUT 6]